MRGFLRIKIASCLIRRPFMPVPIRLGHWKIEFSQLSSSAFLFSWFVAFFAGCTHTHTYWFVVATLLLWQSGYQPAKKSDLISKAVATGASDKINPYVGVQFQFAGVTE